MYLKRYRKGKGRRKSVYVNVAHNIWVPGPDGGGQTVPVVLLNLGLEAALARGQKEATLAMAEALYEVRIKLGDSPTKALAAVREHLRPAQEPRIRDRAAWPWPGVCGGRHQLRSLLPHCERAPTDPIPEHSCPGQRSGYT